MALMKCKETLQTDCLLTKFMMQRNKCQRWHTFGKGPKTRHIHSSDHNTNPVFPKIHRKKNFETIRQIEMGEF